MTPAAIASSESDEDLQNYSWLVSVACKVERPKWRSSSGKLTAAVSRLVSATVRAAVPARLRTGSKPDVSASSWMTALLVIAKQNRLLKMDARRIDRFLAAFARMSWLILFWRPADQLTVHHLLLCPWIFNTGPQFIPNGRFLRGLLHKSTVRGP